MPTIWKILAVAGAASAGLTAGDAQAREYIEKGDLKIENNSSGERKICIYKYERIHLLPQKCLRLKPNQWVLWTRPNPDEWFRVAVTEVRKGFDKLLRTPTLPPNTVFIAVGNNNTWSQGTWRPPPKRPAPEYRVKFCNVSQPTSVWLSIGAVWNGGDMPVAITEGYWGIENGDCVTINYTERLEMSGIRLNGQVPQMMYRAYTTGELAQRWEGESSLEGPRFCVNTKSKFRISHFTGGAAVVRPCEGENEAMQHFLWAPALDRQVQIGRVNF